MRDSIASPVSAPDLRPEPKGRRGDDGDRPRAILHEAPITPLGVQGGNLWLLDALNQLRCVSTDCRKGDLMLWFGGDAFLTELFPQYGKAKEGETPPIVGFNQTHAQTALIRDCHARGIFNPQGRVFGRGAHRIGDDGELMLHMGRTVLIAGKPDKMGKPGPLTEVPAGEVRTKQGTVFFPAAEALPPPAAEPSSDEEGKALLTLLGDWRWVEADAAPILLFGAIAQMFICGALEWRSHVWLAGNTAAGKTTLQRLIRAILGSWALHTSDASEAAVRQTLNDDTLPVLIDEAEADDNPEKQQAMLNLAKKASSGDKILRGSSDHKAKDFTAQSSFLFSSVLHGLSKGEERNRVAILDMRAIPPPPRDANGKVKQLWQGPDLGHWRAVGRRMHRRMVQQWSRFERTYSDYKREIASHGLEPRWQDTYGTLLACADMLLYDRAPSEEGFHADAHGRERKKVLQILPMMRVSRSEARTDLERCITYLLSRQIAGAHGHAPETIGQWIVKAMAAKVVENPLEHDDGGVDAYARKRLKAYGLRIVRLKHVGGAAKLDGEPLPEAWDNAYLAVAYGTNQPLSELFRGTEWSGGKWIQSLAKAEGVEAKLKFRFDGPSSENAIAVPLVALRGEEG